MTTKTMLVIAVVVVLGVVAAWAIMRRAKTEADDGSHALGPRGVPVAAVVKVTRGTLGSPLTLAGAFKPFQDVDVHAKVAGYIKEIYVDVGTHVKAGQTLAVLEVPELRRNWREPMRRCGGRRKRFAGRKGTWRRAKSAHAAVHSMFDRLRQASQEQGRDWWRNRRWTMHKRRIWKQKRRCLARKRRWMRREQA